MVGPTRPDGKHEVVTVLQRLALADRLVVDRSTAIAVEGFAEDTLVHDALVSLADEAAVDGGWRARITKRVPAAAGLGGGSSDAATALFLANGTLARPLPAPTLVRLAAGLGADVPFFLTRGPQLARGDGTELTPLDLPQDYWVVLLWPAGAAKGSTADVYARFDRREGGDGFDERRADLLDRLAAVRRPRDLGALPPNDLASSPFADRLRELGAFRADVTGAGPVVYGLFHHRRVAEEARSALAAHGRSWLTVPCWYP